MASYRHSMRENLWLALDTLRTHKFRSFLTVLSVLVGTTTVIAVPPPFAALDQHLVQTAEQLGTRTLWIYRLQLDIVHRLTREERVRNPLSYEAGMAFLEKCPAVDGVSVAIF